MAEVSNTRLAERLLSRPEGATMDEIVAATGGYQYNVLRRLAARGYVVRRKREGRATRYWAVPPAALSFQLTVAPNGQTTLPKEARDRLKVSRGGKLSFTLETDNRAVVAPLSLGLRELRGLLPKAKARATLEEIEEGIVRGATKT